MPSKIYPNVLVGHAGCFLWARISTLGFIRILHKGGRSINQVVCWKGNIYCNSHFMKRFFTSAWAILKKTAVNFYQDDSMSDASSIAFYTIFSLPAILIIALSIGTTFYERNVVQDEMINQVERLIGMNSEKEITEIISNASFDATSAFAKVVGVLTLIFSATTVFVSLQSSLNKIWGIKPKPGRGIVKFVINRLLSLAMVAVMGFLLLVS